MRLFTFTPEWSDRAKVTLSGQTKVLESLSSRELRFSPGGGIQKTFLYHYDCADVEESTALKLFLNATRDSQIVFPVWQYETTVAQIVGQSITCATASAAARFAGRYAILYRDWKTAEVVSVASVAGASLSIQPEPELDWGAGDRILVGMAGTIKVDDFECETDEIFAGDIKFIQSL